jgi:hypothetical protein
MPPRARRRRGHIEPLRSGSFRAIGYAGVDPLTRKPRYLKETTATYDQAEIALTRLLGQVDQNRHPKSDITVSQAIAQWLDTARHEDTTRARYEDLIRLYIAATLGDLVAGKLDAEILERFYTRLQPCRALCDGRQRVGHVCRPLSASTVRKIHYIVSAALEQAVRSRLQVETICRAGFRRWAPIASLIDVAPGWSVCRAGASLELLDATDGLWAEASVTPDPEWMSAATSQRYVIVLYDGQLGVRTPPGMAERDYTDAARKREISAARQRGMAACAIVEWRAA